MGWDFSNKQTMRNSMALLLPFFILALQLSLQEFLSPYVWILFFPTVCISAWLGNLRIGFISATIATLLGLWFFVPPTFTFVKEFKQYGASFVFLISGIAFVIFHDRLRKLNQRNLELINNNRLAEKRHMEEILSLSEYKYSLIFDKSPFAITLGTFPEANLIAVNDAFLTLFEYTREEVIGKTTIELGLNTIDSLNEVRRIMHEFGKVKNFECILKTKTGKEVNISLNMNWVSIRGVNHTLATLEDISTRKKAEDAMHFSEDKFSVLFHKGSLPSVLTKFPNIEIVDANEAFLELFGYEKKEVIGHTSIELGLNRDINLRNQIYQEIDRDSMPKSYEQTLHSKSGSAIEVLTSLNILSFGENKFVLATIQDITFRKKTEAALIQSEERYRTILNTMLDCVITINEKGIIQSTNRSIEATFGYTPKEILGQNVSILMPEIFAREHDSYLQKYLETGKARIIGIGREVTAKRKDQSIFPVHLSIGEFVLNNERNYVGIVKDITTMVNSREELRSHRDHLDDLVKERTKELRLMQQNLVIAKERAEQANKSKTIFLASASHDLRQPLQAANILIYLLGEKVSDAESNDLVEKLKSSLESLGELLNSLLDISNLDAGMIYPDKVGFPLSAIFKKISNDMAVIAESKGLVLRVLPTNAIAYSDPKLLEQIIRNLVFNAIKYTKTGRILLGVRQRGARLLIQVYDTGIGIPNDKLDKIFEEFYQVNNSARNRKKGLGLGLAIVRRLAKLMGHSIEVRSNVGRGSKFEITVPMSEVAKRKDWFNNHSMNIESKPKVIIVIEDENENLETLGLLLKLWGHTVIATSSAEEALNNLRASKRIPDIILADYRLENEKTGIEAIALIRSEIDNPIPALLLTGDTSPDQLLQAKTSNLKILHKPINPLQLKNIIGLIQKESRD